MILNDFCCFRWSHRVRTGWTESNLIEVSDGKHSVFHIPLALKLILQVIDIIHRIERLFGCDQQNLFR